MPVKSIQIRQHKRGDTTRGFPLTLRRNPALNLRTMPTPLKKHGRSLRHIPNTQATICTLKVALHPALLDAHSRSGFAACEALGDEVRSFELLARERAVIGPLRPT